jgi:hypothetical protein
MTTKSVTNHHTAPVHEPSAAVRTSGIVVRDRIPVAP